MKKIKEKYQKRKNICTCPKTALGQFISIKKHRKYCNCKKNTKFEFIDTLKKLKLKKQKQQNDLDKRLLNRDNSKRRLFTRQMSRTRSEQLSGIRPFTSPGDYYRSGKLPVETPPYPYRSQEKFHQNGFISYDLPNQNLWNNMNEISKPNLKYSINLKGNLFAFGNHIDEIESTFTKEQSTLLRRRNSHNKQLRRFRRQRSINQEKDMEVRRQNARTPFINHGERFDSGKRIRNRDNFLALPKLPPRPEKMLISHPSLTDIRIPINVYSNTAEEVADLQWELPWKEKTQLMSQQWTQCDLNSSQKCLHQFLDPPPL